MLDFLVSDGTQRPYYGDKEFYIDSNKDFIISKGDFEEYKLGVRFDFNDEEEYIELQVSDNYSDKLSISSNILKNPNYKEEKQTVVILTNKCNNDISIKRFQNLIIGRVKKLNELSETPAETSVETVMKAPVETVTETPVEALVETDVKTPVETVMETPVEALVETAVETPVEAPVETPVETPMEVPSETHTVKRRYVRKKAN